MIEISILFFQHEMASHGIDWDGPLPENVDNGGEGTVEVPQTVCPLSEDRYRELSLLVDPLRSSECYGIDIYTDVLSFFNEN